MSANGLWQRYIIINYKQRQKEGKMKLKINNIQYHRNGICGEPFYVINFDDKEIVIVCIHFKNMMKKINTQMILIQRLHI